MTTGEKISMKIKQAWAAGKFANSRRHTEEIQKKATAKTIATKLAKRIIKTCEHCGRQWSEKPSHSWRRFCSRKCRSAAATGRVQKPCPDCGAMKWRYPGEEAKRCRRCSGLRHRKRMKQLGIRPKMYWTAASIERQLAKVRSDENRKRVSLRFKDVPKEAPSLKKFSPHHCCAVECWFRDPNGVVHYCRNISRFVHENARLFHPFDVEQKCYGGKPSKSYVCNATHGLSAVHRGFRGSWKGWEVVSHREGRERFDLIGRNPAALQTQGGGTY